MTELLSIGEVATATGSTVVAVRHYESLGLVDVAGRVGGKRRFLPIAVGRVNFVRRAQEAGFSLVEIGAILDDDADGRTAMVDAKIAELSAMRSRLNEVITLLGEIRDCGCQAVDDCSAVVGPITRSSD